MLRHRSRRRCLRVRTNLRSSHLTTVHLSPGCGRLLIVEDDRDLAESLLDLLEPEGFEVRLAGSASAALEALVSFAADAALIDLKLGQDNGVELLAQLKAQDTNLVCILMTAYSDVNSAVHALRLGAQDYLTKPLEPANLPDRLRRAIGVEDSRARHERAQRLQTLGTLCAAIAHDVNNCLQIAHLELEALTQTLSHDAPPPPWLRQSFDSLVKTLDSAAGICRSVSEFGKGEGPQNSDVSLVLRQCQPLLVRLTRSQTRVSIDMAIPDVPLLVPLTHVQVEQVVLNLAVNACQAIPEAGTVRIHLGEDEPTSRVRLSVTDTGKGIDPEVLPRIFEPYFSTKAASGTGLGLAIVSGIVQAARGEIQVRSAPGEGTTFDVLLPKVM